MKSIERYYCFSRDKSSYRFELLASPFRERNFAISRKDRVFAFSSPLTFANGFRTFSLLFPRCPLSKSALTRYNARNSVRTDRRRDLDISSFAPIHEKNASYRLHVRRTTNNGKDSLDREVSSSRFPLSTTTARATTCRYDYKDYLRTRTYEFHNRSNRKRVKDRFALFHRNLLRDTKEENTTASPWLR